MAHRYTTRVYYEDTDTGGVVYYANYLKFAERARTEALREVGIDQSKLLEQEGLGFVVRACEVDFIRPARLDEVLTINTSLKNSGKASIMLAQEIISEAGCQVNLSVKIALIDADFRPARLPERIELALNKAFS